MTAIAIIAVGYLPKANSFSGFQGKTLWDWLSLLVVPASLAGLGALLQLKDQDRAKKQADLEREIADKNRQQDLEIAQGTREEEALQHYLDRVSNLVIEKNLLAIAAKAAPTTEEKELLEVSAEIIRALTVSTLRRLSDGSRKASVVRFLIEADIILGLKVRLEGADLQKADLSGTYLDGAILNSAILDDAKLEGASLNGAELKGAKLKGAWLNDAKLSSAKLNGADLTQAKVEGANLEGANLREAKLINANLVRADLTDADLVRADLTDANLSSAKLNRADLTQASLEDAILNNAKLINADLSHAHLGHAKLIGAELLGAFFIETDLSGANLSCATALIKEKLEEAYLCETKLPKGIDLNPDRDCDMDWEEWRSDHGYT
jgi:uncharacterized protein YjbI with pentapeptide repeats